MEIKSNNYTANPTVTNYSSVKSTTEETESKSTSKTTAEESADKGYVYDSSESKKTEAKEATYKPDMDKVNKMIKESEEKIKSFREMIEKLIMKQGDKAQQALATDENGFPIIKDANGNLLIEVDEETRLAAQEAISEDGYYGVEQTATRILDFAKAISGGDPDKIEKLRKAVEGGFEAATKKWGGELPEISQKTYEAVMKGFDDWANERKTPVE